MLFLSYAEEDGQAAQRIAAWLRNHEFDVYVWQDERGMRIVRSIENAFYQADAFLVLLSPDFLTSGWCTHERDLAITYEKDLKAKDPSASFIRVLQVRGLPDYELGFLMDYDRFDLTGSATMERELLALVASLRRAVRSGQAAPVEPAPRLRSSVFRNREDELERVLRGMTNLAGPHFWLVIAPPQLGKTWFMGHLAAKLMEEPVPWAVRRVDLREQPAALRRDAALLLSRLFGLSMPLELQAETFHLIARKVLQGNKPYLCLLDSAELLEEETASRLRFCLGQVYDHMQRAGRNDVRLAFLVASRRDTEWRGVSPAPRLSPLPLTEFKIDVVRDALDSLASDMGRTFSFSELQKDALLVHGLSEGLPALLIRCLRVVETYEWVGMERLETQEQFEAVAFPYVRQDLLAAASLFPSGHRDNGDQARALEHALRALAPYRLFTQSHLRHSLRSDPRLARALEDAAWSIEDLWDAISGTALLSRPLDEPWQEMQPAIRRLLYRYYYKSDELRAEAHQQARRFAEIWSDGQTGKEQVIGLVECLWHEAAALLFSHSDDLESVLTATARRLARALHPSPLYTVSELREAAARRMRGDEEFQRTVDGVAGLFTSLVRIVAMAEEP